MELPVIPIPLVREPGKDSFELIFVQLHPRIEKIKFKLHLGLKKMLFQHNTDWSVGIGSSFQHDHN